ncbi:20030_t:CDS:2, partial [Cetraspora pellucida]
LEANNLNRSEFDDTNGYKNLLWSSILQTRLDVQANILSNNHLKEIFINSENKINNSFQIKEIIDNISYLPYPHITIDNGSNIKSFLEKLEQKYSIFKVYCFDYTLQLAINNALKGCPKITNLIKKYKDVVSHFSRSSKQKQFLLKAQIEMKN